MYWPLDKSWYEGFVKSFDKKRSKHLVQYDDAEEELLELGKEKIEWVEQSVTKFKRLRRGSSSSLSFRKMVIEDDDDEVENLEDEDEVNDIDGGGDDDSSDEDWGKSGEKEVDENSEEEEGMEIDDEDEENGVVRSKRKPGADSGELRKRKIGGGKELGPAKKTKGGKDVSKGGFKVSIMEPSDNADSK